MEKPIVAWSHSALDTYNTCPKKYYHEKILKDVPFSESDASIYGKEVHKAFELYLGKNQALPFGLTQYAPYLDKFKAVKGKVLVEQRVAINNEFMPTGYFDKDVWFRGQADLIILQKTHAVVVDWKTGKLKDNFDQLDLMAAACFCLAPEIETMDAMFWWTQSRKPTSKKYKRSDVGDIWGRFLPKVKRLEDSIKTTTFPAHAGWLCGRYCGVKSCPNHGS
jgi:hypothetical protein